MFLRFPMWIVSIFSENNPLTNPILFKFSIWDIFLYLLGVLYFVTITYFTGRTLGKRLLNLKVISSSGENLTFMNVLYRETIGRYLSSLMCLGYLLIGVDSQKRGLHDILCDTRVVYSNLVILADDTSNDTSNDRSNNFDPNTTMETIKDSNMKEEDSSSID